MPVIPVKAVPSQRLSTTLAGQICNISLYEKVVFEEGRKRTHIFLDLILNGTLIAAGVVCHNASPLILSPFLGFVGELAFFDLQGNSHPQSYGLGSRWFFCYLPAS